MADETLSSAKTFVRTSPPKGLETKAKMPTEKPVDSKGSYEVPKELLLDLERSDKMIRDNNIKVVLFISPGTPTEKQISLPSVARAIKAKFLPQ